MFRQASLLGHDAFFAHTCNVLRSVEPLQEQMKTLSVHAEMAKAFTYMLKQWDALNEYCRNGQVEIDNNIGENALRAVAVGRKNYLFFGSDHGGEAAAIIYSLLGTCKLNGVEPEGWLREVIGKINDPAFKPGT